MSQPGIEPGSPARKASVCPFTYWNLMFIGPWSPPAVGSKFTPLNARDPVLSYCSLLMTPSSGGVNAGVSRTPRTAGNGVCQRGLKMRPSYRELDRHFAGTILSLRSPDQEVTSLTGTDPLPRSWSLPLSPPSGGVNTGAVGTCSNGRVTWSDDLQEYFLPSMGLLSHPHAGCEFPSEYSARAMRGLNT